MNAKPLLLIGGGALLLAALMLPGQDGRQDWTLSRNHGSTVRFQIERWKPNSHTTISSDVPLDRFHGLSPESFGRSGPVQFEYVQDAGRLLCEGRLSFGRGSGKFTFVPNPEFTGALTRLGYDAPRDEQLFDMLLHGISVEFARAAKDADLHASLQQLIELRIHGIDAAYIKDVHDAGFQAANPHDLVQLKIHGVSAPFLAGLTAAGYDIPVDRVVQLRIHGVEPAFLRDAKSLGYDFSTQELVSLKIHGVDGRYLRRLHDSGMKNLNAEQIQKLKIHGID
jgi:hypothetical protein